jgi:hypothetical protein
MSRISLSHSSHDWRDAAALMQWLGSQQPALANRIFLDIDPQTGLRLGKHLAAQRVPANTRAGAPHHPRTTRDPRARRI